MDAAPEEDRLRAFVQGNKVLVGCGVLGVGLLLVGGGTFFREQFGHQTGVEIISSQEHTSTPSAQIVVDVGGAVVHSGVYTLAKDARVDDALTAAGGMAETADRIWVRRFINKAAKIPDGAKIYIPTIGETYSNNPISTNKYQLPMTNDGEVAGVTVGLGSEQSGLVNINTASTSELDSLWGVGEKRAADIVNHRPYSSIDEVVSKAGLPKNVFEKIKTQIVI